MPLIQNIDKKKFHQKHPIYKGSSIPYESLNNHEIYLRKKGNGFDFSGIINAAKTIGNVINDNRDTIGSVVSAVGSASNAIKAVSDTVKVSKELEKVKTLKRNTKPKDIELTEEQNETLKKLGNGFIKV